MNTFIVRNGRVIDTTYPGFTGRAKEYHERMRTEFGIEYPESDGEPLGESDFHVDVLVELLTVLRQRFVADPSVYVAADNMMYYVEGEPKMWVSPDVYVVKGVGNRMRPLYKVWEEGKGPDVVIEITSWETEQEDLVEKKEIYEKRLNVKEYYIFDPTRDYIEEQLRGWVRGPRGFTPATIMDGRTSSKELGLDLKVRDVRLLFIDPATGRALPNYAEVTAALRETETAHEREAAARREAEAALLKEKAAREEEAAGRREEAAGRKKEAAARREAERALAEARAEIERLKNTK